MIALLPIGFGFLVLGLRLMSIRNSLRGQTPSAALLNLIGREGLTLLIGGVIILVVTIIWKFGLRLVANTEFAEFQVLLGTGASMAYLSLPALLQWTVGRGRGTERGVLLWARTVTIAGALLVAAYVIYRVVVAFAT